MNIIAVHVRTDTGWQKVAGVDHEVHARMVIGRTVTRWLQESVPLIGVHDTARLARNLDVPLKEALLILTGRRT